MSSFLYSRDILLHFSVSLCLFLGSDTYLGYNSCQTPSYQDCAPLWLGARHNSHGHKQVSAGGGGWEHDHGLAVRHCLEESQQGCRMGYL